MIIKNIFLFGQSGFIGTYLKSLLKNQKDIKIFENPNSIKHKKNLQNNYDIYWKKIINKCDIIVYLSFNNDLNDLRKNASKSFSEMLYPLHSLCQSIKKSKKKN